MLGAAGEASADLLQAGVGDGLLRILEEAAHDRPVSAVEKRPAYLDVGPDPDPGIPALESAWRPDSREVVITLHDVGKAATYDVPSGRRRLVVDLGFAERAQGGVAYRPNGRTFAIATLAGGTGNVSIVVVDDVTGSIVDQHESADPFSGIAYVSGGQRLATIGDAHGDGDSQSTTLELWDAKGLVPIGAGIQLPGAQESIEPSPDGTHLLIRDTDGTLTVWDLRSRSWVDAACVVAGRPLSRTDWARYMNGRPYKPACR